MIRPLHTSRRVMLLLLAVFLALPFRADSADSDDPLQALNTELAQARGAERVRVLNQLAQAHWGRSADQVLTYAREAAELATQLDDAAGHAEALRNIAIGYWYEERLDEALDYASQAARAFEQAGDEAGVAAALSLIGTVHLNLEHLTEAKRYYLDALAIAESIEDRNRIGIVLSNLGTVAIGQEDLDAALLYLERALPIFREQSDPRSALNAMANIAGVQRRLGRHEEAIAINREIIALAEQEKLGLRVAHALTDLSHSLMEMGELAPAREASDKALAYAREQALRRPLRDALKERATLEERSGQPAQALRYFREYADLRFELNQEEQAASIAELQVAFDTERKEREIALQKEQIVRINQIRWALTIAATLLIALVALLYRLNRVNRENSARFERLSRSDPLTGLANRRAVVEALEGGDRTRREPLSVILLDIDHFKAINDRHGHDAGDAVLRQVAHTLREGAREGDLVARWGGEEFLVVVRAELEECRRLAERLLSALRGLKGAVPVTATAGVAAVNESLEAGLRAADAALYAGKQAGRDRVIVASEPAG